MILLIDTATALCSVALSHRGEVLLYREAEGRNQHASMAAVLVEEVLHAQGLRARDLDAVCVSAGPGSYTGLRVGVSTAKGLCFGAGIPLIGIGTLDSLVAQAAAEELIPEGCRRIVPMIDARRMEVYSAVYTPDGEALTPVSPVVVTEESFAAELAGGSPVLFIGDGAEKCREPLGGHPNATFVSCSPKARSLAVPATKAYNEKRFEDLAYFEPFYLKEFVATISQKRLF